MNFIKRIAFLAVIGSTTLMVACDPTESVEEGDFNQGVSGLNQAVLELDVEGLAAIGQTITINNLSEAPYDDPSWGILVESMNFGEIPAGFFGEGPNGGFGEDPTGGFGSGPAGGFGEDPFGPGHPSDDNHLCEWLPFDGGTLQTSFDEPGMYTFTLAQPREEGEGYNIVDDCIIPILIMGDSLFDHCPPFPPNDTIPGDTIVIDPN